MCRPRQTGLAGQRQRRREQLLQESGSHDKDAVNWQPATFLCLLKFMFRELCELVNGCECCCSYQEEESYSYRKGIFAWSDAECFEVRLIAFTEDLSPQRAMGSDRFIVFLRALLDGHFTAVNRSVSLLLSVLFSSWALHLLALSMKIHSPKVC